MEASKIEELIAKYNEGLADPAEIKTLESLIEEGVIDLTRLHELSKLDAQLMKTEGPSPSLELDSKFQSMLSAEKKKINQRTVSFWPELTALWPRLAFAASLMIVGFAGGYWLQHPSANPEVRQLTAEVSELKEMMQRYSNIKQDEKRTEYYVEVNKKLNEQEIRRAEKQVTNSISFCISFSKFKPWKAGTDCCDPRFKLVPIM